MENEITNTSDNEGNKKIVEDFYTVLPDLYRMARIAYNIQSDEISRQEEVIHKVMLNAKNFLLNTASNNNGFEFIMDIVSDNISNDPATLDPTPDNINIAQEKGQGI